MQGRSNGYIYPQNQSQVDFLWGKNDVKTAIEHEY